MADWHQSVMFHLPPLVSISELTGDMPDLTGVWDADNIPGPGHKSHKQQESSPRGPRSVRDCIQTLMQDQIPDIQLVSLRQLSISNLYLIILGIITWLSTLYISQWHVLTMIGLSSAIISANHMCTISPSGPAIKRALTRWQDIWKLAVNNMRSDAADASGIERYSDGQSWAARKMLEALVSGDELHPYLRQAGHETLAEFHSFLLESQKAHDAH